MTQQPKSRTVGCWLILDDHGDTWRVQCQACNRKESFSRYLLGAIAPRCKCGGKVAGKPLQAPMPITHLRAGPQAPPPRPALKPADNPVDKIATPPVADALFGIFGMVPVKADKPKPEPKLKAVKEPKAKPVKEPKPPKPPKELRVKKKRVRASRAVPGARPKLVPVKYLPGEEYGTLTVLREGTRRGRNRMIVCLCSWCGRQWELAITSVRNAPEYCTCSNRHLQKNSDSAEKERMAAERKAKRQAYLAARALDTLDKLIHHLRRRLGQAEARRKKMLA